MEVDEVGVDQATRNQRRKARKKLKREQGPQTELLPPAAAESSQKITEGKTPPDGATNGDVTNGRVDRGDVINGRVAKGDVTRRRGVARGDVTNGHSVSGDVTSGGDKMSYAVAEDTGFTFIGHAKQAKKVRLPPYLPAWYATPLSISTDLVKTGMSVADMPGLDDCLVSALKEEGVTHFFPVQERIIPCILECQNYQRYYVRRPSDLCVCAPTGSGKTLAYAVPILQDLSRRRSTAVRALVLVPGKELAVQVADIFRTFARGTRVRVGLLCGKVSLEQERQQILQTDPWGCELRDGWTSERDTPGSAPRSLVDVVIATPGRLVEHLYETRHLDLRDLEYLVVDEADRMIEEFKNNWFRLVERAVFCGGVVGGEGKGKERRVVDYTAVGDFERPNPPLQKLLFSATLSYDPQRFEVLKLYRPKLFAAGCFLSVGGVGVGGAVTGGGEGVVGRDGGVGGVGEVVGGYVTPGGLVERVLQVEPQVKPLVVLYLLHCLGWRKVLVFTNSLESTHRLTLLVKLFKGPTAINVQEISSLVHQRKRQASLEGFEKGRVDVIVASDAMARGIDLEGVEYVVLYDCPLHVKTYIHRSGRTARAGKSGTVVTLLKPNEKKGFEGIVRGLGKKMPEKLVLQEGRLAGLQEDYRAALVLLESMLQAEKTRHA